MHRPAVLSIRPVAAVVALVALLVSTLALTPAQAAEPDPRPRVMLLGFDLPEHVADVRAKLTDSGAFEEVAAMASPGFCSFDVPTLSELAEYDAVYLWRNCSIPSAGAVGDLLADYVDGGGRLVLSTFATFPDGPQGRLVSGDYLPVTPNFSSGWSAASFVADLPDHPLLHGVTSFSGGENNYRAGGTLNPGSTLVAHWSTGEPFLATRGNVVWLNFFPPSSDVGYSAFWDASTDGVALMVNALGASLEQAPRFSSAASAGFESGAAGSFTVAASGSPKPAISTTSTLPEGLSLTDHGDGTATLAGTPAAGTGGTYDIALTAANGTEPDATQTLALTVNETPVVTSLPTAGFTVGDAGSFTVATDAGFPVATTLTHTGDLPAGLTFTDNGDGTATIAGTPADGSAGSHPITVKAANSVLSSTQELTLTVAKVAQDVTITSAAPAAPVVGQTYEVVTTGGGSPNPVAVSIDPASAGVCAVDDSTVTFQHPGTCAIVAEQAGDGRFSAGSASQTVAVTAAATTTEVSVAAEGITAKVTPQAPGAGTPTGTVVFSVEGVEVGTATLVDGTATLAHRIASGKDRAVAAAYSGDGDFTASSGSTARRDPVITAKVTSARAKSAHGWYRTPVTVTFRCAPAGSALTTPCPKPVTLQANRAGQSVSRTILAADGGAATVTVGGVNIDRSAPKVSVKGVKRGATYPGQAPKARCVGTDGLSGVARCSISKRVSGESVTVTAKVTDRAGNTSRSSVRYRVARSYVAGAAFRNGAYQVREGRTYVVVQLSRKAVRPEYRNAALRGGRPSASGSYLKPAGKQAGLRRYTIGVRMDRGMSRRGDWVLGVKTGSTLHRIPVHVRR